MTLFDNGVIKGLTYYMKAAQRCRSIVDEPVALGGMLAGATSKSQWAAGWLHGIALGAKLRMDLYQIST